MHSLFWVQGAQMAFCAAPVVPLDDALDVPVLEDACEPVEALWLEPLVAALWLVVPVPVVAVPVVVPPPVVEPVVPTPPWLPVVEMAPWLEACEPVDEEVDGLAVSVGPQATKPGPIARAIDSNEVRRQFN